MTGSQIPNCVENLAAPMRNHYRWAAFSCYVIANISLSSRESAESAKPRRRHDGKGNSVTLKAGFSGWSADECVAARLAEAGGRRGRSESKKALERWFGEQLARLYGEILAEPLPDELADLVEKLRRDKKSSVWKADLNRGSNFPEAP